MAISIWEFVRAPIGRVRFRDFYLADVLTSLGITMKDLGLVVFYIINQGYTNKPMPENGTGLNIYIAVISFLPFWWRFW